MMAGTKRETTDIGARIVSVMLGLSLGAIPLTVAVCMVVIIATAMLRCGKVIG